MSVELGPFGQGVSAIRVAVVEDDECFRSRISSEIRSDPGLLLVGEAGTLEAGRKLADENPDILLLDLGLPDGNGLELIEELRRRGGASRVLVFSVFADESNVVKAIEAGADGYLLKECSGGALLDQLRRTHAGEAPISPRAAAHLLRRMRRPPRAASHQERRTELSRREIELLELLARGFSYKEAARRLELSPHTVAEYVGSIYRKLSVNSKAGAVYEAISSGILRNPVGPPSE